MGDSGLIGDGGDSGDGGDVGESSPCGARLRSVEGRRWRTPQPWGLSGGERAELRRLSSWGLVSIVPLVALWLQSVSPGWPPVPRFVRKQ